jgi:phospholipase/carboxylesterase
MIVVSTAGGTKTAVSDALLEIIPADEISNALDEAPFREGPPPDTPDGIPHQQHNQNAPVAMQEALREAASALPGIRFEPTPFSFSGSVGWRLEESFAQGPAGAFIPQSLEFGHQHVPADGSMHMLLPLEFAAAALEKGWGVIHPLTDSISGEHSEYVMIFGPRDQGELRTVWIIAQISYYQARGLSMEPKS